MGILDSIARAITYCLCGPGETKRPPERDEDAYMPPPIVASSRPTVSQQPPPYKNEQLGSLPAARLPHESGHGDSPQGHDHAYGKRPHKAQSPPRQNGQPKPDLNQINQQNPHYLSLRARANEEGDKMAQCFERSHEAYGRGDGALAKQLSNEGKQHQQEMEKLNREASEWIFIENNKDSKPGEVDLHGLYVKEAIAFTGRAIEEAQQRGDSEIHLIVGKGLHSKNGAAKLKPAIEELMQKHKLVAELNPSNGGVLTVSLDGKERGKGRVLRPDDITREIESKEGCIIM